MGVFNQGEAKWTFHGIVSGPVINLLKLCYAYIYDHHLVEHKLIFIMIYDERY